MFQYMNRSKVLLHTSGYESFGMVFIEALIYGNVYMQPNTNGYYSSTSAMVRNTGTKILTVDELSKMRNDKMIHRRLPGSQAYNKIRIHMSGSINPVYRKRLTTILVFAGRYVVIPLGNILISWLVIRFWSADLWGQFVDYLIWVQLLAHILAWGSRDYAIRAFSRSPADITIIWFESLFTRALAIPLALLFLWMIGLLTTNSWWICLWLLVLISLPNH